MPLSENIQKIVSEELEIAKSEIIARTNDAGQTTTGKTIAGFEVFTDEKGGRLEGYDYSGVLERGRRPGNVPEDFNLIIEDWMKAKGITFSSDKEFERVAKAIAWSIKLYGTQIFRYDLQEDIFTTPIQDLRTRLGKRFPGAFSAEIINTVFK
jgi:hypothetical protein